MLKAMRRNVKSLAPTLWIVIAAFIIAIFAVWGGAGRLGEARAENTIAWVGKERISVNLFYTNLRQRLEAMKREFKELDRKLIQQLGIPQQVLEQLIQQTLLLQIARDLGLDATNEEILEKIKSYPVFQRDGKFAGFEEYKRILEWNRISITEFEESLRKEAILSKVVQLITAGIPVTEEEIWENYKKENEQTKLEYILVEKDQIELESEPAPSEIQHYFEENKEDYKIPERREGTYIFLRTEDLKTEIELTDSDLDKYYKDNLSQFEEPERVKVSRIYLPYGNKEKEMVKAEGENIRERITKGESFSELAIKSSEDEKAQEGGDWGFYDWKRLSPPEKEEIEKLSTREPSPVIELEDGVSLLQVTEKNPAVVKPFEEVKSRIKSILEEEKARTLGAERIVQLRKNAQREKSLDVAAQKFGLIIKNTGLLKEGDALEDIDPSGSLSQALFELEEKEITSPVYTYKGIGIAQLEKIEPPRLANFEEVKDEVKEDVLKIKKKEKAQEKMKQAQSELKMKSMEEVAEDEKIEHKTLEEYKRGQYLSIIGENTEIDRLAFSLPLEEASEPIEFEDGYALIKVLDRKEVSPGDFEKNKKEEREKFLDMKKNKFFLSYLSNMRKVKRVRIKYDVFLKINTDVLSRYGEE
jgi:peptidyl-prolyl cis-trans isomerase D